MKLDTIRKTKIYKEFGREEGEGWFSYTPSKFITHVDTFYYSVKTIGDWGTTLGARSLVQNLKLLKEQAEKQKEEVLFLDDLVIRPFFGFYMYRYGISKTDCFDIFVADSVPNLETSPIIVQLRSQFIWLCGLRSAYEQSLSYLKAILEQYGIEIGDLTENRIDYAYHTNYIQNMLSFFKDEHLGQMQVSNFKRWSKQGTLQGDNIQNDYISLGRRASDNAFVRIYNKSKEVIEMGYKQFFVPIWLDHGLISKFDKYVFDAIFDSGKDSWNYKEVARCRFYLEHGQDEEIKAGIRQLQAYEDSPTEDYKKLADRCVPDLTDVVNIEIQTKRKFYYDFVFPEIEYPGLMPIYERRMYKILSMIQSVRDFITHDTIRFVKYREQYAKMRRNRRPTADWWLRLSSCGELEGINYDLCKEYQKRYDVQRSKTRSLSSMATLASLIRSNIDSANGFSVSEDWDDIFASLNDNDLKRYARIRKKKHREIQNKFSKSTDR